MGYKPIFVRKKKSLESTVNGEKRKRKKNEKKRVKKE